MTREARHHALDGLRAIAVAQVVLYHFYFMPRRTEAWAPFVESLLASVDGVTLFFALSGYLIGGILLSVRERQDMMKVFYLRRLFRIVPLYLLLIASYVGVRAIDGHFRFGLIEYWYSEVPLWNYLTFTQNIRMAQDGVIGAIWLLVTWSLAVEQQFYLIAPWLVRWLGSSMLLIVAAAAFGTAMIGPDPKGFLLPDRMDALAAGLSLAILAHQPGWRGRLQRWRTPLRAAVMLYFAAIVTLYVAVPSFDRVGLRPLASLVYALLIHLLADDAPWPVVKPVLAWLAPLGLLSYFIYLFHFPVQHLTKVFLVDSPALAIALTVVLAAVSYRYFERPLIEYGHRFRYGPPREDRGQSPAAAPSVTPPGRQ